MTKTILMGAVLFALCFFSLPVNAQLEVQTSGDVKVSKNLEVIDSLKVGESIVVTKNAKINTSMAVGTAEVSNNICLNIEKTTVGTTNPYYGIKSTMKAWSSMPVATIYGVYGVADAIQSSYMGNGKQIVGVYGIGIRHSLTPTVFTAGVAGVAHYYGGIGVYGTVGTGQLPTAMPPSTLFAGYFDGTVKVNGTLIATATSFPDPDQQRGEPQMISSSMLENIQLLQPVSYTPLQDSAWLYDKEATELQGIHYGLRAKDIEKVFPELVYKRGENLSINYIELIPLLVKTIQELSAEVAELKAQVSNSNIKQ